MMTALIILNYNNFQSTIDCIESVERYNSAAVKYIVVDNGSTQTNCVENIHNYLSDKFGERYLRVSDDEPVTSRCLPYVTFLTSKTNDGYACGNNKGLKLAYADNEIDRLLILNNDILFTSDIIGGLIETKKACPDCAIISPILYKRDGKSIDYNCARNNISVNQLIKQNFLHYYYRARGKNTSSTLKNVYLLKDNVDADKAPFKIELPSGSCMLVDKALFEAIGSFDPNTFLYYEENILFKRVSKLGLSNYLAPQYSCIHLGAESTSKVPGCSVALRAFESMRYYVNTYEKCNLAKLALFNFSVSFARLALITQKRLMSKH